MDEVLYLCLYLLDFRMCLVEVEKSAKPVAACAMPVMNVSEGTFVMMTQIKESLGF